jgi:hypothetical protein
MPCTISGPRILANGQPIHLRGASLGNWMLLESYMMGIPAVEQHMREGFADVLGVDRANRFWRAFEDSYYTEDDIRWLAAQGLNLLRLPLNYRCFHDDPRHGRSRARAYALIDRTLGWAATHGMYVLLDMHAAPGSQADDWNADGVTGEKRLFTDARCADELVQLWADLAQRYAGHPQIMGYDPLCEPVWSDPEAVNALYRRIHRAIRAHDPTGIITWEPNLWGRQASTLDRGLFDDPQCMVHAHWYPTGKLMDGLAAYPDAARGADRAGLWAELGPCLGLDRWGDRPALVGEFGLYTEKYDSPAHLALITDLVRLMEERGLHWSVWAAKDRGAIGLTRPVADSPWMRFIAQPAIKDSLDELHRYAGVTFGEHMEGGEMQSRMRRLFPGEHFDTEARIVREATRMLERLGLRHVARHLAQLDDDALDACASGFAWRHCQPHAGLVAALRAGFVR